MEDGDYASLLDDPVIAALRRYREAAGSSFHPPSYIEDEGSSDGLLGGLPQVYDNAVIASHSCEPESQRDAACQEPPRYAPCHEPMAAPQYGLHEPPEPPRYSPCHNSFEPPGDKGQFIDAPYRRNASDRRAQERQRPMMDSTVSIDDECQNVLCSFADGSNPPLPPWLGWLNSWLSVTTPHLCGNNVPESRIDSEIGSTISTDVACFQGASMLAHRDSSGNVHSRIQHPGGMQGEVPAPQGPAEVTGNQGSQGLPAGHPHVPPRPPHAQPTGPPQGQPLHQLGMASPAGPAGPPNSMQGSGPPAPAIPNPAVPPQGVPPFPDVQQQVQPATVDQSQVGLLGVAMPNRQRPATMTAIRELPPTLCSATYDDVDEVERAMTMEDAAPDLSIDCMVVGEDVKAPVALWGLGHVRRGHVGSAEPPVPALVTQLPLTKPLDAGKLKRLNTTLRTCKLVRDDICMPFGAMPFASNNPALPPGVWIAWSDPMGAARKASSSLDNAVSLTEALRVEPPRGPNWRLAVARRVCVAVDAMHSAGRVHGSFSPRNVWVTPTGDVGIMESGLVDALLSANILQEHDLLSCLGLEFARYLAPEGWQVPRKAGPAADIWALGLVLLEILGFTGHPNPECTTLQQLSEKLLPKRGIHAPRCDPHGLVELAQSTRKLVESCLSSSPDARPNARQVLLSLAAPDDPPAAAPWGSVHSSDSPGRRTSAEHTRGGHGEPKSGVDKTHVPLWAGQSLHQIPLA